MSNSYHKNLVFTAACIGTVSYTHLDVYKRQVLGRQVHVRGKQGFNEPFTDLTVGIGQTIDLAITVIALNGQITALVAVSYTHLDVYKRQIMDKRTQKGREKNFTPLKTYLVNISTTWR